MPPAADDLGGIGLFYATVSLSNLAKDPQRLHRARHRFSESPASYRTNQSHNSTISPSPEPEDQSLREQRKWQLINERRASLPYAQFQAQANEERDQIMTEIDNGTCRVPVGTHFYDLAQENVRQRWAEQGIWNDSWGHKPLGNWKHEEPLMSESDSDSETEDQPVPIFSLPKTAVVKHEPPKRKDQADREREREASRPFHQFIFQVSRQRKRIQDETRRTDATSSDSADINTRAYEEVKSTWSRRGIWDKKWGVLPGMAWKHEQSEEDMLHEEMGDDPPPVQPNTSEGNDDTGGEVRGAPSRLFGPFSPSEPSQPTPDIPSGPKRESPAPRESDHDQLPNSPNGSSSHEPPMAANPDANHSSPGPRTRRQPRRRTQDHRSAPPRKQLRFASTNEAFSPVQSRKRGRAEETTEAPSPVRRSPRLRKAADKAAGESSQVGDNGVQAESSAHAGSVKSQSTTKRQTRRRVTRKK
ncbi:hypothetical protein F4778DRAFT_47245 [Xylariomycetidae sp. FL2044]|nr:hypothetical protein F4778DRAFT_47245 [Xylariomycetidae sp. FL2044]